MNQNLRRLMLNAVTPLSRYVGKVGDPFVTRQLTFSDAENIRLFLKPGAVLVSRKRLELSNLLIPGHFTHAAIVSPNPEIIIEAVGEGVVDSTINQFVLSKDEIALYYPLFASDEEMLEAAIWARTKIGLPYDYQFGDSMKAFYCSKLAYYAYASVTKSQDFTLRTTLGVETVIPQDFVNAVAKWRLVWASPGANTEAVYVG